MEFEAIRLTFPENSNIIVGQSHFIKTAEDLYEALVNTVPGIEFAIAFNEASGPCLVRVEANSEELRQAAVANALAIGAGHVFVVILRNAYPINVLEPIKRCPEVCRIFCATANPVEVLVAKTSQGRGVVGVVDGFPPKGVEGPEHVVQRKEFLRKIGYKL
ncbi:MAG TPA: adenosine-specific kinase [Candidatus Dormibacteraeota bacterium]|nr:adenosine-specific kinase [Candidatus Dormibacteraeota bacterium]